MNFFENPFKKAETPKQENEETDSVEVPETETAEVEKSPKVANPDSIHRNVSTESPEKIEAAMEAADKLSLETPQQEADRLSDTELNKLQSKPDEESVEAPAGLSLEPKEEDDNTDPYNSVGRAA